MAVLIDTSILVRLANAADRQHATAARAVLELHRRGEVLHVTSQVLIEFRNVATRPKSGNGAGLPITDAEAHAAAFEARFPLLAETPDIFSTWKPEFGIRLAPSDWNHGHGMPGKNTEEDLFSDAEVPRGLSMRLV